MSQQLMDYVAARHEALLAVLKMLTAEYQLSDSGSSVLDVTSAEQDVDGAAGKFAGTMDELPRDRKPDRWNEPPEAAGVIRVARVRFVKAALRCLLAGYDEGADADAGSGYADDLLALAARNLAADAEARRAAKAEAGGRLL